MFLTAALLLVQAKTIEAPVQTWDKLIAPGVTYRMQVVQSAPWLIHAVRITPAAKGVLMTGELANGRVFNPESEDTGRETVSQTAKRTGALVAVNADYFPFTGDPLGAMVKDGELLSSPYPGRATLAWGGGAMKVGYLSFSGTIKFENGIEPLQAVNEECLSDMLVFNTPTALYATSSEPATHAVLEFSEKVTPVGTWKAKVKRIEADKKWIKLGENEAALTFRGKPSERLVYLSPGDEVQITLTCTGTDWAKTTEVVAGGPILVAAGKKYVPYKPEGFTEAFATKRHPRTAVGVTKDGDVWFVAVDGRQSVSAGMTLEELADYLVSLGCVEAMNLDGGGSTTVNVRALTLNRPSGGDERPVANSILVYDLLSPPVGPVSEVPPVVAGPASLAVGSLAKYSLVGADGKLAQHNEVLWSASGAAWIDQDGVLHGASEGDCRLTAWYRGSLADLTVKVVKG